MKKLVLTITLMLSAVASHAKDLGKFSDVKSNCHEIRVFKSDSTAELVLANYCGETHILVYNKDSTYVTKQGSMDISATIVDQNAIVLTNSGFDNNGERISDSKAILKVESCK